MLPMIRLTDKALAQYAEKLVGKPFLDDKNVPIGTIVKAIVKDGMVIATINVHPIPSPTITLRVR